MIGMRTVLANNPIVAIDDEHPHVIVTRNGAYLQVWTRPIVRDDWSVVWIQAQQDDLYGVTAAKAYDSCIAVLRRWINGDLERNC